MPGPSPLAPFIAPLERLALPYCIRFIVAGTPLDAAFLETEVARLGLRAEWERSRK